MRMRQAALVRACLLDAVGKWQQRPAAHAEIWAACEKPDPGAAHLLVKVVQQAVPTFDVSSHISSRGAYHISSTQRVQHNLLC